MEAAAQFGMALEGEMVADAAATRGAGHRRIGIAPGTDAVITADQPKLQRPIRKPGLQQVRSAVHGKADHPALPIDVGDHHLRFATAIDAGHAVDLELPGLHVLGGLTHAVDVQVDGGRQHRLTGKRGQRSSDAIGLQREIAGEADAADAGGAGPRQGAGDRVAHGQAAHAPRQVELPPGVEAHVAVATLLHRLVAGAMRQHGIAPDATAQPEQPQLGGGTERAETLPVLREQVVVEDQPGRPTGRVDLRRRWLAEPDAFGRSIQQGHRDRQLEPLGGDVVDRLCPRQAVQHQHALGSIAAGPAQAQLAQGIRTGREFAVVQDEARKRAGIGAIEHDLQVQLLGARDHDPFALLGDHREPAVIGQGAGPGGIADPAQGSDQQCDLSEQRPAAAAVARPGRH